jgi:hypothetical protein
MLGCWILALGMSCKDDIKDLQVTAVIKLQNVCEYPAKTDTVDIVMRFTDTNGTPLVDADVYRAHPISDSIMKFNLRLKESDNWAVTTLKLPDGRPFCSGACLQDTTTACKMSPNSSLGPVSPVTDTILVEVLCQCLPRYN